jgi:hypothetical protein
MTPGRKCIGFGEHEGKCPNTAGTPWTKLWCLSCDEARRASITASMKAISASFKEQG